MKRFLIPLTALGLIIGVGVVTTKIIVAETETQIMQDIVLNCVALYPASELQSTKCSHDAFIIAGFIENTSISFELLPDAKQSQEDVAKIKRIVEMCNSDFPGSDLEQQQLSIKCQFEAIELKGLNQWH